MPLAELGARRFPSGPRASLSFSLCLFSPLFPSLSPSPSLIRSRSRRRSATVAAEKEEIRGCIDCSRTITRFVFPRFVCSAVVVVVIFIIIIIIIVIIIVIIIIVIVYRRRHRHRLRRRFGYLIFLVPVQDSCSPPAAVDRASPFGYRPRDDDCYSRAKSESFLRTT